MLLMTSEQLNNIGGVMASCHGVMASCHGVMASCRGVMASCRGVMASCQVTHGIGICCFSTLKSKNK
jgi:hypothetical protein